MRHPRVLYLTCLIVAVLALPASTVVWGQSEATTGSLRGTITDPKGGAVPGAKLTAKNPETGYTRDVQTGDEGYSHIRA